MISKRWSKLIRSLQVKKYRKEHQAFLVEGTKSLVEVLMSDLKTQMVFCTEQFYELHAKLLQEQSYEIVTEDELTKVGTFSSNNGGLAIVSIPEAQKNISPSQEYVLVLDNVNDPGNLGTIIRLADWYGIKQVVCSKNTADVYNPKVIAASMGSFTRIEVKYTDLVPYLESLDENIPIYGALLNGNDVHKELFTTNGCVVMGNEANGISEEVIQLLTKHITIPSYGQAESLNVGIATAIILDNIKRGA